MRRNQKGNIISWRVGTGSSQWEPVNCIYTQTQLSERALCNVWKEKKCSVGKLDAGACLLYVLELFSLILPLSNTFTMYARHSCFAAVGMCHAVWCFLTKPNFYLMKQWLNNWTTHQLFSNYVPFPGHAASEENALPLLMVLFSF